MSRYQWKRSFGEEEKQKWPLTAIGKSPEFLINATKCFSACEQKVCDTLPCVLHGINMLDLWEALKSDF